MTIRATNCIATILLATFCLGVLNSFGQSLEQKEKLFDRGMELLQSQEKIEYFDYLGAFEATQFDGFDRRVEKLISTFQIAPYYVLSLANEYAETVPNFDFLFRHYKNEDMRCVDAYLIADLAFEMGAREHADASRLFELVREYVDSRERVEELFLYFDRDLDLTPSNALEEVQMRLMDEVRYSYQLGRLLKNESPSGELDEFRREIKHPVLRENLLAFWLWKIGATQISLNRIEDLVAQIESDEVAVFALSKILPRLEQGKLDSNEGRSLVKKFLDLYTRRSYRIGFGYPEWMVFEADEFGLYYVRDMGLVEPIAVFDLCRSSGLFQSNVRVLDYISERYSQRTDMDSLETFSVGHWASVVVASRLDKGEILEAKRLAASYSIKISPRQELDALLGKGDYEAAKMLLDSNDQNEKLKLVLAVALMKSGDPDVDTYVERLESGFWESIEKVATVQQGEWLINKALTEGWRIREIEVEQHPLEGAILEAFDKLPKTEQLSRQLANSLNSMTPPTAASRRLLLKMMEQFPDSEKIVTRHELNELIEKIRAGAGAEQKVLLSESISLVKRATGESNAFASELAFEFAKTGNNVGIQGMLNRIDDDREKCWALFQCCKALSDDEDGDSTIMYSRRRAGGFF